MENHEKKDDMRNFPEIENIPKPEYTENESKEIKDQPEIQHSAKLVKEESGNNNMNKQELSINKEKDNNQHLKESSEGIKMNPLTDQKLQKLFQSPKFREIFELVNSKTLKNEKYCRNNFIMSSNQEIQFDNQFNKKIPLSTWQSKMNSLYKEIKLMSVSKKSIPKLLPNFIHKHSHMPSSPIESHTHNSTYIINYYQASPMRSKPFQKVGHISPNPSAKKNYKTSNHKGFRINIREDTRFGHYENVTSTYNIESNRNKKINISYRTNLSSLMCSFPEGHWLEGGYGSDTFYENKKSEIKSLITIAKESRLSERVFPNEKSEKERTIKQREKSNIYGNNIYTKELQSLSSKLFANARVTVYVPHVRPASKGQYICTPGQRREPLYSESSARCSSTKRIKQ